MVAPLIILSVKVQTHFTIRIGLLDLDFRLDKNESANTLKLFFLQTGNKLSIFCGIEGISTVFLSKFQEWHSGFMEDCPDGELTKEQFVEMYNKVIISYSFIYHWIVKNIRTNVMKTRYFLADEQTDSVKSSSAHLMLTEVAPSTSGSSCLLFTSLLPAVPRRSWRGLLRCMTLMVMVLLTSMSWKGKW